MTPTNLRLPFVALPPGSILMPSVRLMDRHTLQLKEVTLLKRHTFTVAGKTYGTVRFMVNMV